MRKTSIKTTRYESGKWFVDIIELKDSYEAWLLRKDSGVSTLMFGSMKKNNESYEHFCELVEANIPDYKRSYDEEQADLEEFFCEKYFYRGNKK